MAQTAQPKKGMRFYHSRVLDTMKFDGKSPQLFEVTWIARGAVYFRPVYDYGTREEFGAPGCCPVEQFPRCRSPTPYGQDISYRYKDRAMHDGRARDGRRVTCAVVDRGDDSREGDRQPIQTGHLGMPKQLD